MSNVRTKDIKHKQFKKFYPKLVYKKLRRNTIRWNVIPLYRQNNIIDN